MNERDSRRADATPALRSKDARSQLAGGRSWRDSASRFDDVEAFKARDRKNVSSPARAPNIADTSPHNARAST